MNRGQRPGQGEQECRRVFGIEVTNNEAVAFGSPECVGLDQRSSLVTR